MPGLPVRAVPTRAGGIFPTVASVYGMEDAAGNSRWWTDTWFDEEERVRELRGGAYSGTIIPSSAIGESPSNSSPSFS